MQGIDFKEYKLKDVCEILRGQAFRNSSYKGEGIPVIKVSNIQNGKIETKNISYVNPNEFPRANRIKFGDLVLSITHPVGKVAINLTEEEFLFDSHTFKLAPNEEIIDKRYLYYFLLDNREKIESLTSLLNLPTLKKPSLENLEISIPSLEIQRDTVKKLDEFMELQKELLLRKKQHNYYRGKIMNSLSESIPSDIQ